MSRLTAALIGVIVLLVAGLMFVVSRHYPVNSPAANDRLLADYAEAEAVGRPKLVSEDDEVIIPNGARQGDGWNCDTHQANADALGLEGYRLSNRENAGNGQQIEVWRNIIPPDDRKHGRDDVIRVQHSTTEDCVVVEPDTDAASTEGDANG